MREQAFWKQVTMDDAGFLPEIIRLLETERIAYAVIGGQAVNAYVDPLVSLDLDLAVAAGDLERTETALRAAFRVAAFPHSLNVSAPGSGLRIQIQTDPRYAAFVPRASVRDVLGFRLPVADVRDVLQGKIWAAEDPTRRPSKRQKDLADIARLIEKHPELRGEVPQAILDRLI